MKKVKSIKVSSALLLMISTLCACSPKETTIQYEIKDDLVGDVVINGKYTKIEGKVERNEESGKEVISDYSVKTLEEDKEQDQIKDPSFKVTLTVNSKGEIKKTMINDKELKENALEDGSSFFVTISQEKKSYKLETKIGQSKDQKEALENMKKAMEVLDKEHSQANVDKANEVLKTVSNLNKKYKEEVSKKIKEIQDELLVAEAEKALKEAEANSSIADTEKALAVISKLPTEKQTALKNRVATVSKTISSKTPTPTQPKTSPTTKPKTNTTTQPKPSTTTTTKPSGSGGSTTTTTPTQPKKLVTAKDLGCRFMSKDEALKYAQNYLMNLIAKGDLTYNAWSAGSGVQDGEGNQITCPEGEVYDTQSGKRLFLK